MLRAYNYQSPSANSSQTSLQVWIDTQDTRLVHQVHVALKVRGVQLPSSSESPSSKLLAPIPNNLKLTLIFSDHDRTEKHDYDTQALQLTGLKLLDPKVLAIHAHNGPVWAIGTKVYAELQVGTIDERVCISEFDEVLAQWEYSEERLGWRSDVDGCELSPGDLVEITP